MFTVVKDLLKNWCRKDRSKRWSDATKDLMALLYSRSSAHTVDMFATQLGLMSSSTIKRHINVSRREFRLGFDPDGIAWLVTFYVEFMARHSIPPAGLLCFLAEDETAITGGWTYRSHDDTIYGHCGLEGPDHKCNSAELRVEYTNPSAYETLKKDIESRRVARCKWRLIIECGSMCVVIGSFVILCPRSGRRDNPSVALWSAVHGVLCGPHLQSI
jgi:hypothetical protein